MNSKSVLFAIVLAFSVWMNAFGQGIISTVAGGNGFLDNIPAVQARLQGPGGLAVDAQGNAFITDGDRIRRIDANTGVISTVSANLGARSIAFEPDGSLAVLASNQILKLNIQTGSVKTIAGVFQVNTPQFGDMVQLATDTAGNIYVADDYYDKIYRFDAATGAAATYAGIGQVSYNGSPQGDGGAATQAGLLRPFLLTVDPFGNVFVADQYYLRRIDAKTGIISTVGTNSNSGYAGAGVSLPVPGAKFGNISALTTDAAGNLYVADGGVVRKIDWVAGTVTAVAGSGKQQYAGDGVPALQANLSFITGLVIDAAGNLWIADPGNARLFVIPASTGLLRTVAGSAANGDGGPALGALLAYPSWIAAGPAGDFYVVTTQGIRHVDNKTGFISTVASGQGPIALDSSGILYQSPAGGYVIRKIDPVTGAVTTVAGGNGGGFSGDNGPALQAQISPSAVAVDSTGNIYLADNSYRIRRVDGRSGIITTVAGNGKTDPYTGGTGPATQIAIGLPTSIAAGPDGNIYWTTSGRVLRLDASGNLSVAAGNGGCVYAGDGGSALLAPLCQPVSLAFDGKDMFIAEANCGCIRRVAADTGLIQTVGGTGLPGSSGDSILATQAAISPASIAFAAGSLYVVDYSPLITSGASGRVRSITPPSPPALPQPPKITQVTSAVDYRASYSPGALISLFGNYLSSPTPAVGSFGSDGILTKSIAGDQVLFNGVASPLLYASPAQINAIVPWSMQPGIVSVQLNSAAGTATLSNFLLSQTSIGFISNLVVNPDGTFNSAANPAPKGATLVLYGTGMGATNPGGVDGSIAQGPPFAVPASQFAATLQNGSTQIAAPIAYLGPLPTFVSGAVQLNVQIPANVPPGSSTLSVSPAHNTGIASAGQTIYMLSDIPAIQSVSLSPVPQVVGQGSTLTLTGAGFNSIKSVAFYVNGQPVNVQAQIFQPCADSSCKISANFSGQSGAFSVTLTNAANQTSAPFAFTVPPYAPPTIQAVTNSNGIAAPVLTRGTQIINVVGTNFQTSSSLKLYRGGTQIAVFDNATIPPLFYNSPQLLQFDFDFQGIGGEYSILVATGDGQSSNLFTFTLASQ